MQKENPPVQKKGKLIYDQKAKAPFLANRSNAPLVEDVLCDAVRRGSYSVTVSDKSWEIIRALDPALRKPTKYKAGECIARNRMRVLLEDAALNGNAAPLKELFQAGLLQLRLSRVFCFAKSRANTYAALLKENGDEPPAPEAYEMNGLLQLLPWDGKNRIAYSSGAMRMEDIAGREFALLAREQKFIRTFMANEMREGMAWEAWARKHLPKPPRVRVRSPKKPRPGKKSLEAGKTYEIIADSPPPTVVRHSIAELKTDAWTPDSVLEPKDYGMAVLRCWAYIRKNLEPVSENANVVVEITAGSNHTTYKTAAADRVKSRLPLFEISLDIANGAGRYSFQDKMEGFAQGQLRELLDDIVFSSKR